MDKFIIFLKAVRKYAIIAGSFLLAGAVAALSIFFAINKKTKSEVIDEVTQNNNDLIADINNTVKRVRSRKTNKK